MPHTAERDSEREKKRERGRYENCIDFRVANNVVVVAAVAASNSFDAVATATETATETMPTGAQHSWHSFREQFRCQEAWGVQCSGGVGRGGEWETGTSFATD